MLPNESIEDFDGTSICLQTCSRHAADETKKKAPDKVELWSDSQTGVAIRPDAPHGTSHRVLTATQKISLVLVDEPVLANDWFTATGHSSPNRRILRFDSTE